MSNENVMKESKNLAAVEGLLQELDLTEANDKNGRPYIRGKVIIRTEQKVGMEMETSEIPVTVFAYRTKNDGNPNPAYQNIKALEGYKRITTDGENADKIRVTGARISENVFAPDGKLILSWVLNGSFFTKITGDYESRAVFDMAVIIRNIEDETLASGALTDRLKVTGLAVRYNGEVDSINFIVENPQAIVHIKRNWAEKDTVNVKGYIRVRPVAKTSSSADGGDSFGDIIDADVGTRVAKELVIAAGSNGSLDADESYDFEDVKAAVVRRKARLDAAIAEGMNKNTKSATARGPKKQGWSN